MHYYTHDTEIISTNQNLTTPLVNNVYSITVCVNITIRQHIQNLMYSTYCPTHGGIPFIVYSGADQEVPEMYGGHNTCQRETGS